MRNFSAIILCLYFFYHTAFSQSTVQDSISGAHYLHIYLDGAGDWENYIKVKLWYIDYVRDPKMADVQVIITSQETAAGGSEYYLFFLGWGKYSIKSDTLHFTSHVEYTNRRTRDELTNVLTMGLMPYMVLSEQYKYMAFDYTNRQKETLLNYTSGFQIGIRYVFGSIYNNIVNPRYEGGVDISQEVTNVSSEGNTEGAD